MSGAGSVPERDLDSGRELRRHVRKRVLWSAKLETTVGSFDCVILNISRSGAKLRISAPPLPPHNVELMLESCGALHGEVVWQEADKLGLRFSGDPEEIARIIGGTLSL